MLEFHWRLSLEDDSGDRLYTPIDDYECILNDEVVGRSMRVGTKWFGEVFRKDLDNPQFETDKECREKVEAVVTSWRDNVNHIPKNECIWDQVGRATFKRNCTGDVVYSCPSNFTCDYCNRHIHIK